MNSNNLHHLIVHLANHPDSESSDKVNQANPDHFAVYKTLQEYSTRNFSGTVADLSKLISNEADLKFEQPEINELVQKIYQQAKSTRSVKNQITFLVTLIRYGNTYYNWDVAYPGLYYRYEDENSLHSEKDAIHLHAFRCLEKNFLESILHYKKFSKDERFGQIIFSAIGYGALLAPSMQKMFTNAQANQWVVEKHTVWVELKSKNAMDFNHSRWFPDPITELLILQWLKDFSSDFPHDHAMLGYLKRFLNKGLVPKTFQPKSIAEFSKWAASYLFCILPPHLFNAASNTNSSSVFAETWLRISSGKRINRFSSIINAKTKSAAFIITDTGVPIPDSNMENYIKEFKGFLKNESKKETIKNLGDFLTSKQQEIPAIIFILGQFCLHLLKHGGRVKSKLEIVTVTRYLNSLSTPLIASFSGKEIRDFTEDQWIGYLQDAINISKDQMTKNRMGEFALFLLTIPHIPQFNSDELDGPKNNKKVNANLVCFTEFEAALELFPKRDRISTMRRLVGILGMYCGLRSGEAMHVRIRDFSGKSQPELRIWTTLYYRTKNRSHRLVDLKGVLPENHFNELMNFIALRKQEESKISNQLLFCFKDTPSQPISYNDLISPIIKKLHEITGDQTIVFHTLRHSYSTFTLLRLMIPEYPCLLDKRLYFLNHELFDLDKCQRFRQRMLSNTSGLSKRDLLNQLSMSVGHASPLTTTNNYLHLFDWIIHRILSRRMAILSKKHIISLLDMDRTTYGYEVINKLRSGDMDYENILEYGRKPFIQKYSNPLLSQIEKPLKKRISKNRCYLDMTPLNVAEVCRIFFCLDAYIEDISSRLLIDPAYVCEIKKAAENLNGLTTRTGKQRFPLIMPPLSHLALKERDRLLAYAENSNLKKLCVRFGIEKFLSGDPNNRWEIKMGSLEDVRTYIAFLSEIGIPKSRILFWYYPDSNLSEKHREEKKKYWSKATGISVKNILTKPNKRARPSKNKKHKIGWISVFAKTTKKGSTDKCLGTQHAIYYIALFVRATIAVNSH